MPDNGSIYRFHHFIAIDGLESDDRTGLEFGQRVARLAAVALAVALELIALSLAFLAAAILALIVLRALISVVRLFILNPSMVENYKK